MHDGYDQCSLADVCLVSYAHITDVHTASTILPFACASAVCK